MVTRRTKRSLLLGGTGLGLAAAGAAAGRTLLRQWHNNPDPLDGRPVRFPDGERRTVQLPDGAEINTVRAGHGPTIVMVHGLTASLHDWGPIATHLIDAGFSVLAIDQRGHGQSTEGDAGYGSSRLADDLARVLDDLDVRAEMLVGHSMGAMSSMALAVHHRQAFTARVARLALIATAADLDTARHRLGLLLGGVLVPEALMPGDGGMRLGAGLGVFGERPSMHMIDEAIASFRACDAGVRTAATVALSDHDVVEHLGDITVPTIVIGAGRDQLIRPAQVRALAHGIPGARLEMFPAAGHMVIWERHREIAALLLDELRTPTH